MQRGQGHEFALHSSLRVIVVWFNCCFPSPQPALLYLVPACIGFPLLVALAKGEVTEMFR